MRFFKNNLKENIFKPTYTYTMENLFIKEGERSPKVELTNDGTFSFIGKSVHEDTKEFFKPILDWVKEFSLSKPKQINVIIELEYFNTSSSKYLYDILKIVECIYNNGCNDCKVTWIYEEGDDDIHDAGLDYESIIKVPFNIISK